VAIQNAGKVDARKREDIFEQEWATAEKKIQMEEERKDREENKRRRVKEEWQKNVKLGEEQRKKEDKVQFDKSPAKTLVMEGDRSQGLIANKVVRREMTSAELNKKFRESNAAQMKANTRAAVDQMVGAEVVRKKDTEKFATVGRRMTRTEEGTEMVSLLPPITALLRAEAKDDVVTQEQMLKKVTFMKEKKGEKVLKIPESVVEDIDLESGEEEDFRMGQRNEVVVDTSHELPGIQDGVEIGRPVEEISTTFLQGILSDQMDMGEEYNLNVQAIVHELEESGREAGLSGSPSRSINQFIPNRHLCDDG